MEESTGKRKMDGRTKGGKDMEGRKGGLVGQTERWKKGPKDVRRKGYMGRWMKGKRDRT